MGATERARRADDLYYGEVKRSDLCHIIARLEEENVKLRELVKELYAMAYYEAPSAFDDAFIERLTDELGIEVG